MSLHELLAADVKSMVDAQLAKWGKRSKFEADEVVDFLLDIRRVCSIGEETGR